MKVRILRIKTRDTEERGMMVLNIRKADAKVLVYHSG